MSSQRRPRSDARYQDARPDPRSQARPQAGAGARGATGGRGATTTASTGPRISPGAVILGIGLVGSVAYALYAITVRDASQIPLLASGAVVLGLVFGALALYAMRATWRAGVAGRDGKAIVVALVGGVSAIVAAGCFAGALILFALSRSPT